LDKDYENLEISNLPVFTFVALFIAAFKEVTVFKASLKSALICYPALFVAGCFKSESRLCYKFSNCALAYFTSAVITNYAL